MWMRTDKNCVNDVKREDVEISNLLSRHLNIVNTYGS